MEDSGIVKHTVSQLGDTTLYKKRGQELDAKNIHSMNFRQHLRNVQHGRPVKILRGIAQIKECSVETKDNGYYCNNNSNINTMPTTVATTTWHRPHSSTTHHSSSATTG